MNIKNKNRTNQKKKWDTPSLFHLRTKHTLGGDVVHYDEDTTADGVS
ncbi:MAG: hypothetical protein R6W78_17945 [Bacteroidales bacterium]